MSVLPIKSKSLDNRSQTSNKNNKGSQGRLKKPLWLIKDKEKTKQRIVNRAKKIWKDNRAKINTIKHKMWAVSREVNTLKSRK